MFFSLLFSLMNILEKPIHFFYISYHLCMTLFRGIWTFVQNKMPAFSEDKFSAGRTKCMSPMLKNKVEQSRTIPNKFHVHQCQAQIEI